MLTGATQEIELAMVRTSMYCRSAVVWWSVLAPVTRETRVQFPAAEAFAIGHHALNVDEGFERAYEPEVDSTVPSGNSAVGSAQVS